MAFIAPGRLSTSGRYVRGSMASLHATGFVVLAGTSCRDLAENVSRLVKLVYTRPPFSSSPFLLLSLLRHFITAMLLSDVWTCGYAEASSARTRATRPTWTSQSRCAAKTYSLSSLDMGEQVDYKVFAYEKH